MAYQVMLPPYLLNSYDVFHVSQSRKYIPSPSHVIQLDDVKVRENLIVETLSLRIEDREVKYLRGKEITSMKFDCGGPAGGGVTWELDSRIKESYSELFPSGNFRGRKFIKVGESCNTLI